jgi:hypothetical protein
LDKKFPANPVNRSIWFPVIKKDKIRGEGSSREVIIYPKEKEHTARPSPALSSSSESLNKQIYSLTEFELR